MKITPIEIRQKTFEKEFRGYNKEEVEAFLSSLSQEWEKLNEENREYRRRLENSEKEVQRLREVENSLFKTLKTAEDTGNNLIDQANKSAQLHVKEAQMKAEGILSEAKSKARDMLEEAEEKAKEALEEMQDSMKKLAKEYEYIEDQKDNLSQTIKNTANDILERLNKMGAKSNSKEVAEKLRSIKSLTFERKSLDMDSENMKLQPIKTEEQKDIPQEPPPQPDKTREDQEKKSEGGSFFDNL